MGQLSQPLNITTMSLIEGLMEMRVELTRGSTKRNGSGSGSGVIWLSLTRTPRPRNSGSGNGRGNGRGRANAKNGHGRANENVIGIGANGNGNGRTNRNGSGSGGWASLPFKDFIMQSRRPSNPRGTSTSNYYDGLLNFNEWISLPQLGQKVQREE